MSGIGVVEVARDEDGGGARMGTLEEEGALVAEKLCESRGKIGLGIVLTIRT